MSSWTHRLDTRYSRATSTLLLPCSLTAATTTRPTDTPHLPESRCERCPETGVNYVVEPDTAPATNPNPVRKACGRLLDSRGRPNLCPTPSRAAADVG